MKNHVKKYLKHEKEKELLANIHRFFTFTQGLSLHVGIKIPIKATRQYKQCQGY